MWLYGSGEIGDIEEMKFIDGGLRPDRTHTAQELACLLPLASAIHTPAGCHLITSKAREHCAGGHDAFDLVPEAADLT